MQRGAMLKMRERVGVSDGPLILITDPLSFRDNKALAEWLTSQEIVSYKASDAIDAVGYISDFTQSSFPDLITIPKGEQDNASTVSFLIESLTETDYYFSVFQYSEESTGRRFISLQELEHWQWERGNRASS